MSGSHSLPETKDLIASVAAEAPFDRKAPDIDDEMHGLLAAVLEQLAQSWRAGQGAEVERCLGDHPELLADPEAAVRLIYEEFCLREELGEKVDAADFFKRFPQYQEKLTIIFECHRLLHDGDGPSGLPRAGEQLGEFKLVSDLGRGALGRVFLAIQPSLSDRPLAVKITTRTGQEHLSLARLQHTNIVPLYLVQDFPERQLRALCMPYLGGATWSAILKQLAETPPDRRSGKSIAGCLATDRAISPVEGKTAGPALGFLNRAGYTEAVCWIGAALADALYYAHQRGLVHLDIKPSNVLIAADGQPMLLDFHLAREIEELRNNSISRLGGTPGYMSPEQTAATDALRGGTLDTAQIDGRSDIYSLGVLLYESLTGELLSAVGGAARSELRLANPHVSPGLEDLVCKCLVVSKESRYANAGQLADDLRCHLANLPLRGVANRSFKERWRKWRRRKPHSLPIAAAASTAMLTMAIAFGVFYRDRVRGGEAALVQSQRELESHQIPSAIDRTQSALWGLRFFPWKTDLQGQLKNQLAAAQRAQAVASLHEMVQQLRFLDNETLARKKLAEIAVGCDRVWQSRTAFAAALESTTDENALATSSVEQLRDDLLDLGILSTRLNFALNSQTAPEQARANAVQRLQEAQQLSGASPVIDLELSDYKTDNAASPGANEGQSLPPAKTAWEHNAIGRWLLRHQKIGEADRQFQDALQIRPDDFWANFQEALCKYKLSQFDKALTYVTVCVALAPDRPECYYNRALVNEALGQNEMARSDLNRR